MGAGLGWGGGGERGEREKERLRLRDHPRHCSRYCSAGLPATNVPTFAPRFQWRRPPEVKKYRRKMKKEDERARLRAEKEALIPPWAKALAKALEEGVGVLDLDGLLVEELEEDEKDEEQDEDVEKEEEGKEDSSDNDKDDGDKEKEGNEERPTLSLLHEIPHKVMRKLKKFRVVQLARNGLREIGEKHLMKRLAHLESLDMSDNEIRHIPKSIMSLKTLTSLSLSGNELEMLPIEFFHLDGLKSLKLANNELADLPLEMGVQTMREHRVWELGIGNLTRLTELDVSNNKLTQLPEHREGSQRTAQFGNIESLQVLDLSKNLLTYLPEEFGRLVKLRSLEMAHNGLEKLPEVGRLVFLSRAGDPTLNSDATHANPPCWVQSFQNLVELDKLDFSFNQIDKVDRGFCKLVKLVQ